MHNNSDGARVWDAAIIGAGVTGSFIARELTRKGLSVALLDKAGDVCMGASKANSAIVHGGFDATPNTLKALLNLRGCQLMPKVADELSVDYEQVGSLVLGFSEEERVTLEELLERGRANGVSELSIIERERIQELEPNINPDVVCALWAPVSGIVCPFELTLAAAENAVENGAVFLHSFEVVAIENNDDGLRLISQDGRDITAKIAVNAAGIYSDKVAALFGDESICIEPRRGQYMLLDKTSGDMANRVLFQCPTPMGKGILVTPTVHGNLLVGPSAEVSDRDDSATDSKTLCNVAAIAKKSIPSLNMREIITSFAGIRAHDKNDDFVIGFSKANPRLYNAAGIESPGLTSAPAIGEYAAKEIAEFLGATDRADFNPIRVKKTPFNKLSKEEQVARAKSDSNYGKIVCRCETVTRGDILCALRSPIPARNIDGIKRRVRPTMGRCQGGFCCSICAEILADELNIPLDEITKFGGKSKLLTGKIA